MRLNGPGCAGAQSVGGAPEKNFRPCVNCFTQKADGCVELLVGRRATLPGDEHVDGSVRRTFCTSKSFASIAPAAV